MKNFIIVLSFLFLYACGDDEEVIDYKAENQAEIQNYILKNNLTTQSTTSGLHYMIETVGTGIQPNANDNVTVAYKGYFTSGSTFDESDANGVTFNLQNVIKGWTEGIPYFKEGGSGKLFVPAHLGYGSSDRSGIPAGSVLVFDIRLVEVVR